MIPALQRQRLPQTVLSLLPFVAFFTHGLFSAGVAAFLIALAAGGRYGEKLANVRAHPMFVPVLGILVVTTVLALFQARVAPRFWWAFAHYQSHLFLLLFVSVGAGAWQRDALRAFLAGGVVAATIFYLKHLGLLPQLALFKNYEYSGNNSILIGILLALASGILLARAGVAQRRLDFFWRTGLFLYVASAVLFFAHTRTGMLVWGASCLVVLAWLARRAWKRALALLVITATLALAGWQFSTVLQARVAETSSAASPAGSVQSAGKDVRVELFEVAVMLAREKPLTGHGIGSWRSLNEQHARSDSIRGMSTPHSEYLLHVVEVGLVGLAALLYAWATQLWLAVRMGGLAGLTLLMTTMTLLLGGLFNAILRDLVFGLPLMLILAIPLAGSRRRGEPGP